MLDFFLWDGKLCKKIKPTDFSVIPYGNSIQILTSELQLKTCVCYF